VGVDVRGGADVGVAGEHLSQLQVACVAEELGDGGVSRLMHRLVRQADVYGIVEPDHNCKRRPARTRRYFQAARQVRDNATTCALCGKGPRPDDPWVADHIIPRAEGGTDTSATCSPPIVHATADAAAAL
jgi:hypothetical protein